MNHIDLKGRQAVITGGAAGIGLAIGHRFVASGARVAIWDLDERPAAAAASALGAGCIAVTTDVTREGSVQAAVDATVSALGCIDILVCSAGIAGPNVPTVEYSTEAWHKVFDVNVHGLFYCNRAVARVMLPRDYGRIINIALIAGKDGNPNAPAYSASKAAVIGLTKSLGKELAKSGIRVNCVTPAAARTAIFDQMTPQHIEFMLSKIPMGRFCEVDEIAAMVAWMASEECAFSTGAVFDLSGGRAVY